MSKTRAAARVFDITKRDYPQRSAPQKIGACHVCPNRLDASNHRIYRHDLDYYPKHHPLPTGDSTRRGKHPRISRLPGSPGQLEPTMPLGRSFFSKDAVERFFICAESIYLL